MAEKGKSNRVQVLSGNEACALGALAAGMRFYAGYPITPSSEVAEVLSLELPKVGGVFIQMEDEIASIGAIIGASLAGSKSMTATSGPGFSLMQENIGYASMAEVPIVIVNVMRGGPSTGLPTMPAQADIMQARWGTHGDHPVIALAPYSVREAFTLTVRAFNLAESFRTPVVLLMDEILGHVNEKVVLPLPQELEIVDRVRPQVSPQDYLPYAFTKNGVPPMVSFGEGYRYHVTGLAHDESGFPTNQPEKIERLLLRLNGKLEKNRENIVDFQVDDFDDAQVGVISYGSSARAARHAVRLAREAGIKAGLFRLKTIWPFADQEIEAHTKHLKAWIVPEMNLGQIAHEVEWVVGRSIPVHRINRIDGNPINPLEIMAKIKEIA
ncbi:2-oxoacid:acceptor oxidoreductase subunit alpha [candidate division KSB1 bacterium]|nr:2-oxoacid:acceptor oxidoreductase subunit alpha [candidate division KSB1 bacterium]